MLCLHGGWPRTGTSALQAALVERSDQLASIGLLYPQRWRSKSLDSHHGLTALVEASDDRARGLDELKRYLDACSDRDLLFSAEGMTGWLLSDDRREGFLDLIAAAREVTPVRCVWTMRRLDDWFTSIYLLLLALDWDRRPPVEYFGEKAGVDSVLFEGMKMVEEAVGGDATYVKYAPTGMHGGELLAAFGVPDAVATPIQRQLTRDSNPGSSLSHKEASVLANLEDLSARAGVDIDRAAVRRVFSDESFEFEQDGRCELVGEDVRRAVHERALVAAAARGIESYVEFFEDAEIAVSVSPGLDPENVAEQDLERLVERLQPPVI